MKMKLKTRIRNKTLNKTIYNTLNKTIYNNLNHKLSSFAIASIILLTSLTASIIFIPFKAKAEGAPENQYVNLLPDAEGSTQQWLYEPSDPKSHYDKVDDTVGEPDDDGTYVYTDRNEVAENFNHETSALLTGATISNVRVIVRARTKIEGVIHIGLKLFEGVTDYAPRSIPVNLEYSDYDWDWALKPGTGEPWSKADIDDLQSSIKSDNLGKGDQLIVTQVYINVTYTPASLSANVDWGDENKINGVSYVISANNSTGPIANYTWTLSNGTGTKKIYGQSWIRVNYRLAGIYTINLTISNSKGQKAYAQSEVTIKQYISVVKNNNNNGVNYVTWGANNSIMASKLAQDLGLGTGDIIEKFNPISGAWDIAYNLQYGSGDFKIFKWDHIMIDLQSDTHASYSFTPTIESLKPNNVTMNFTSKNRGYNYITWSRDYTITPADFITALKTAGQIKDGEDITIYVYNPTTNIWASYNPNIPEVFNTLSSIQPYDVICFHAPNHKDILYRPDNW
ncbi:MAG: hypothetical protein QHH19_01865 [Candidatus Thermoplasmatota archaeon]|nr:hypothetical protein [Candidatus Thermoplasmatota archaeon]